MENNKKIVALDVGGSHVAASLVTLDGVRPTLGEIETAPLDTFGPAYPILQSIAGAITRATGHAGAIEAVGLAFPGPFDYPKGVSAIAGVGGKFESTFGLHVRQALQDLTGMPQTPFCFANDAHCFAVGAYRWYDLQSRRTMLLTLGTGFGSAFLDDGALLYQHPDIPASGAFFPEPFLDSCADDYFSTRWFQQEYRHRTGRDMSGVKALAEDDSPVASAIFQTFAANLGAFLLPWLQRFQCDTLVIGGNIARAAQRFSPALDEALQPLRAGLDIRFSHDTESCIFTGAAVLARQESARVQSLPATIQVPALRKTRQPLLPVEPPSPGGNRYNIFPTFKIEQPVFQGFEALARQISGEKTVVLDGYGGVCWEPFRVQLHQALTGTGKRVWWYDINAALKSESAVQALIAESLNGDDPVFGKRYPGALGDFFEPRHLALLRPEPSADLCILYGTGAALADWEGPLVYVDVPKNEIQYRMRAGAAANLGASAPVQQWYKRCYFVDWPVLNRHKERLLPAIDVVVDEQRITDISFLRGDDFRQALDQMLGQPFRARPWFEPGVWGGDWMKTHIPGLPQDEVNYAWSFELITPENGIVFESEKRLLEVSFDMLLYHNHHKLLGKAAQRFGKAFPIRFDFLDTRKGGNLSIQCHPRTPYIQAQFGEDFTQDETYYVLDNEPGACAYLGFQEDIDPAAFRQALQDAQENGIEVPIERFVQKHPARPHDLFLIPNGTIHAQGKNNMVLEISSTPYIFTFKMYDWLRLDLNGQPRPINIEHAFNNLNFERKGAAVRDQLLSKPQQQAAWPGGEKYSLPTHPEHFYAVDRYEFSGEMTLATAEQCLCCMLVHGTEIEVVAAGQTSIFRYVETFVIPASVGTCTVRYHGPGKAFLLVAYVK